MTTSLRHMHCRNYAPVDVVKGVCHVTKGIVYGDKDACPSFARLPQCAACKRYLPSDDEYLGFCSAAPDHPMTYPDLAAVTCEGFEWKSA
ncbi:MAG: 4-hydroxyphenylacetate decarboxylase small subunit [Thermotogota bacterium]